MLSNTPALEAEGYGKIKTTIRVLGVDNKIHMAEPHEDKCLCGANIKRKKLLPSDNKLYSCYQCTY